MKEIICAFLGTAAALWVASIFVDEYVEKQKREMRAAVNETIQQVVDAPGNAVTGVFESLGF